MTLPTRCLLACLLLGSVLPVAQARQAQEARQAQSTAALATPPPAAAPALTPEQQAALAKQDAEMQAAANQVHALVDGDRAGELWDGASGVMKRVIGREEFIRQLRLDRERLGAMQSRGTAVVSRTRFAAGAQVPEGLYVSVATPTRFANAAQPVRELVSFRLDQDRVWRVSGYSVR